MPFNGLGIFNRVYSWEVDASNNLNVDATRMDVDTNDIADALSNCVTRDGQSPALANLPLGGFKLTGMGVGSMPTDSVNYGQVFNSPVFVSPSATASPPVADNSFRLATTAWVTQVAFSAALPAQPGTATPLFLRTLLGSSSWASISVGNHVVTVHTGSTMGSTNTQVRRFTTILTNVGTAITYADSATNGASFTINEDGLYSIAYNDRNNGNSQISATLNSATYTIASNLVGSATDTTSSSYNSAGVVRLSQGDIVRPTNASPVSGSGLEVYFSIRKVGF